MKTILKIAAIMGIILISVSACVSTGSTEASTQPTTEVTEMAAKAIPGFVVKQPEALPVIDGKVGKSEWKDGILYPLGYNQLNLADQRPPMDQNDLTGDFTVLFDGKTLYGMVMRKDDTTFVGAADPAENDNVEIFVEQKGKFAHFRTVVGKDFEPVTFGGSQKAAWSADGSALEFSIDFPNDLKETTCGWAIALADNDGEGLKYQLFPITGEGDSAEGKNLGTLVFGSYNSVGPANVTAPFKANQTAAEIVVDGNYNDSEWADAVKYQLLYDQIGTSDVRLNRDYNDLYGDWGVAYKDNTLYGYVNRKDDRKVTTNGMIHENDCVEVYLEVEGKFIQIRSLVGRSFDTKRYKGVAEWNKDGTVFEYSFTFDRPLAEYGKFGWCISLTDSDSGASRETMIYPMYGANFCWQGKDLAELEFVAAE